MTSPAFRAATIDVESTAGTDSTLTPPTGLADDDILIFMMDRAVVTGAVSRPTGFAELFLNTYSTERSFYGAWKRASSESGNYAFTWTGNSRSVGIMFAISGCVTSGDPTTIATIVTGTDANPNSGSADPGAVDDYLAITCFGGELKSGTVVVDPSGYTAPTNHEGSTSGSGGPTAHSMAAAWYLQYTGQSQDPPAATISTSADWAAQTILLDPVPDVSSSSSSPSSSSSQQSLIWSTRRAMFRPQLSL